MAALASHVASVNRLVAQAQTGLFSGEFTTAEVKAFESDVLKQSWMMTIALFINVSRVSKLTSRSYLGLQAEIDVCTVHFRS